MDYLRIKNWAEFQHYKDRNPPWIKLHRALLDNYEFCSLQDAQKAHLVMIWIHASQNDGLVPKDAEFLQQKLSIKKLDLDVLIAKGFLIPEQDASKALADCKQDATKHARLEEKRREEEIYVPLAQDVISYLNEKSGRNFQGVSANTKFIVARLKEGATPETCKAVIDSKVSAWLEDKKMSQYLRPETLFNETKFASYVGDLGGSSLPAWER
jgi:uncharacterized phage protein (TIGR02220 family)